MVSLFHRHKAKTKSDSNDSYRDRLRRGSEFVLSAVYSQNLIVFTNFPEELLRPDIMIKLFGKILTAFVYIFFAPFLILGMFRTLIYTFVRNLKNGFRPDPVWQETSDKINTIIKEMKKSSFADLDKIRVELEEENFVEGFPLYKEIRIDDRTTIQVFLGDNISKEMNDNIQVCVLASQYYFSISKDIQNSSFTGFNLDNSGNVSELSQDVKERFHNHFSLKVCLY